MNYASIRIVNASNLDEAITAVQDGEFDETTPICDDVVLLDTISAEKFITPHSATHKTIGQHVTLPSAIYHAELYAKLRNESAISCLKAFVDYLDSDLSEAETILINRAIAIIANH